MLPVCTAALCLACLYRSPLHEGISCCLFTLWPFHVAYLYTSFSCCPFVWQCFMLTFCVAVLYVDLLCGGASCCPFVWWCFVLTICVMVLRVDLFCTAVFHMSHSHGSCFWCTFACRFLLVHVCMAVPLGARLCCSAFCTFAQWWFMFPSCMVDVGIPGFMVPLRISYFRLHSTASYFVFSVVWQCFVFPLALQHFVLPAYLANLIKYLSIHALFMCSINFG